MAHRNFSSTSSSSCEEASYLPSQFKFLEVLGQGSYGKVVKCYNKDTCEIVAMKIPKSNQNIKKEVSIMKKLMRHNLDQCNIVKYIGSVHVTKKIMPMYELLDVTLQSHILQNWCAPMPLSDIRSIIKQMATALNALRRIGVIHTDIKLDNIMLVDDTKRPLAAKLIDFGLAIPRNKATQGMAISPVSFRSPEVILGLPFSEATDMWSLGCVMATMLTGTVLFPAKTEYEALGCIMKLLGQPADHLLNKGQKTSRYYTKNSDKSWRLKRSEEFWGTHIPPRQRRDANLNSLDDLKKLRLERSNKDEAEEREQYIELLKSMLDLDATSRITPDEVLTHPFIDQGHHSFHSNSPSTSGTAQSSTTWDMSWLKGAMKRVKGITPLNAESGLKKTSESSVTDAENAVCDDIGTKEKERKKRKNCFQRFRSWMRKTFCSRRTCPSRDQEGKT